MNILIKYGLEILTNLKKLFQLLNHITTKVALISLLKIKHRWKSEWKQLTTKRIIHPHRKWRNGILYAELY